MPASDRKCSGMLPEMAMVLPESERTTGSPAPHTTAGVTGTNGGSVATKLLETERIVVWDIVWPKGQPTAMHRHPHDQVGTYYSRGGRLITQPDGTKREGMTEVGNLSTTRKGTTHIEEGATDPPLRAVFIE